MNSYKYLLCMITLFTLSGLYQHYMTNECQYALDKYYDLKCCKIMFPNKTCIKDGNYFVPMRPQTYFETLVKYIKLNIKHTHKGDYKHAHINY